MCDRWCVVDGVRCGVDGVWQVVVAGGCGRL